MQNFYNSNIEKAKNSILNIPFTDVMTQNI
jgi:hypothetical protein